MKPTYNKIDLKIITFISQDVIRTSGDMDDNEWDSTNP